MSTELRDPLDDQQLEQRLRATFATMMPLLDKADGLAGSDSDARQSNDELELVVSTRDHPQRGRRVIVSALATAAAVAALGVVVMQRDPSSTPASDSVPDAAPATVEPSWYRVIRPFLPTGFDQIALTDANAAAVSFKAWRTGTGQILDITIGLRTGDLKQTIDPVSTIDEFGTWFEFTSTVALQTADGRMISLRCGVIPVEGGAVGDVAMAGTTRDYCGDGFDHLDIDAASRHALVARLATDFPVAAVDAAFGAETMSTATDDMRRAAEAVKQVLPQLDISAGGTQGRDAVQMTDAPMAGEARGTTLLTVVHGVYPPSSQPVDKASLMTVFDDVAVGWVVNDHGIGFQFATKDVSAENLEHLGGLLSQLALATMPNGPIEPSPTAATTTATSTTITTGSVLPSAYDDVMALLPSDGWIGLEVSPGPGGNLRAFDVAGRVLSLTHLESAEATATRMPSTVGPPMTVPGGDVLGHPQLDGSVLLSTPEGDGASVSCFSFEAMFVECSTNINRPPVSQADLVQLGRVFMPMLRQGQDGPLEALVAFAPVSIDRAGALALLRNAISDPGARLAIQPGVITTLQVGVPEVFEVSDGSTVVSMITADHVLFQARTTTDATADQLRSAMQQMTQFITLGGPTAMTTLPPE